jgi:predicted N-acyltransferase
LTILKDLPLHSPLLGPIANRFSEDLAAECASRGCVLLEGQALAYVPIDFASTGEYLGRLSASRRRDLRRKLRSESSLQVDVLRTGSSTLTPQLVAELYALYLNVYEQSTVHFDCLSAEFFTAVLGDASCEGVLFLYRHAGELIGFNLCFEHEGKLVDKYVGFRYPQARDLNLYFVSWFRNLDYARERGLQFYVAGWTDPQVKQQLGARFTWTRHAVYVRNPLLRAILRGQRRRFEADHEWHAQASGHAARHS